MKALQNILRALVSDRVFKEMKAESEQWFFECLSCGFKRSVWEAGGIKYKATVRRKRAVGKCPECHKWRWMSVAPK